LLLPVPVRSDHPGQNVMVLDTQALVVSLDRIAAI
jgi:hypothetical protein